MISNTLASFIIVLRRSLLLMIRPYKTMFNIANEDDYLQVVEIFILVTFYYFAASFIRPFNIHPLILLLIILIQFIGTISFFYFFSKLYRKDISIKDFVFTFAYTYIPTLIWFIVNLILYIFLPPPRTLSVWGKGFSIVYVSFSFSILLWKFILFYLAVRLSSKLNIYKVSYMVIIYIAILIPYVLLIYFLKLFRVPFL